MPALTTRPRTGPWARCSWLTVIEGDLMVLVVNTPAAAQGVSDDTKPKSSLSSENVFKPA